MSKPTFKMILYANSAKLTRPFISINTKKEVEKAKKVLDAFVDDYLEEKKDEKKEVK